ncbi:retrovirus-related pol polyprotein from transposon TNT 1-94 [Tanacetum coccineum]
MVVVEVPQTLEYRGGQLNAAPVLEVENFTNWKKRFLCHIIGIEPQFENIIKNGPFIPMIAGQRKPANQFTGDERKAANQQLKSLIIYKALMNELVNDDIKLSKLEINTDFINGLPKKWLSFCQSLRNTNHVKDSELAFLFGKLKYEENLIDNIYETKKNKSLVSATPLLTAFFSSSIVQDFQDSPDDKEDTRGNQEYLNDLEEEYQARDLLAKSKRFFKKVFINILLGFPGPSDGLRLHSIVFFSSGSGLTADSSVLTLTLTFLDFGLDFAQSFPFHAQFCHFGLVFCLFDDIHFLHNTNAKQTYIWQFLSVFGHLSSFSECISEQIPSQKKKILGVDQLTEDPSSSGQKDLVFVKSSADDTKVTIPGVERPWLSEAEGFILPNHDTGRILPAESQRNTTDPSVAFTDSSATDYDSADESSVCSTHLPPLKKLEGAEPISGPKTIKSILKSKSTLKAEALKGVIINEPSSGPAKGNKSSSASKVHSASAGKLKSVKIKDDPSLAIVIKELNSLKLQVSKNQSSYPRILFCKRYERTDHRTCDHAEYMFTINMSQHLKSLGRASSRPNIPRPSKCFFPSCIHREREINPRNPQHAFKRCEACGSSNHTTTDHYDTECFKRDEALQAKKAKALKSTRAESSNANRSKTPTKSGCSRHMTGVKSYLHKYVEQPGPKLMFGDDSTCTTEGYVSIKCNCLVFTKFNVKRGTIFNSSKEIVMIAPRVRDVYVLDMTSSAQESCFLAKASENLNWLWHKRLTHLNFKTINKLAKQNHVIGHPSLVYSKDKPCSSCENEKHHRANFKTKQTSTIKKCLHLLHMDLFGLVTPRSINHEKYTLVIIDEYSRYTWVYFLKKKSQAPETIMSFIKRVKNQNDIKVKQLRTDNGTEFKNSTLVIFCDEKGIS